MEERSKWEEIIRSKLIDFEVDTLSDDWEVVKSRLSNNKVVFFRRWYYAAAVIAVFLLIMGGYFYFNNFDEIPMMAETGDAGKIEEAVAIDEVVAIAEVMEIEKTMETEETEKKLMVQRPFELTASLLPLSKVQLEVKRNYFTPATLSSLKQLLMGNTEPTRIDDLLYIADTNPLKTSEKSEKRWSFGAGGGSYSVGTTGGGFANINRSNDAYAMSVMNNGEWYMETPVRRDDNFNDILANPMNSTSRYNVAQKFDISHKQPISLGIGVGYTLNDRWTLQSGLVYTLLSSEWMDVFQEKHKQQLHFVGIPLGLSYKISEWNKLRFYTSTGGMIEWNAGGNIKTKYYYYEDKAYRTEKESMRMKELQYSVNVRVGATYPVIRFINAYIEGGANYYFNNHSFIETIRSDKPFHVSLQAGLRVGF